MKIRWLILISILLLLPIYKASSQKLHYENSDNAAKMFALGNYKRAGELYREIYKKDLTNQRNKYLFAVCLVYTYDREDAIKMLEALSKKNPDKELWYHLGKAYHLENRYDKAIAAFKKFIKNGGPDNLVKDAERTIQMCNTAKQLIKSPLNIEYEKLDEGINTEGDEYLPVITPDESALFFSTRREGTTGRIFDMENYYPADIFSSKYKYWKWKKSRSIGSPNSYGNEHTAGISEDGKTLFYHVDNPQSKNNLQLAEKSKRSYKRAVKLDNKKINDKTSTTKSATISADGNYMIFSSDRTGGYGGQDLYVSKKLPDGKWSEPMNLGDKINTPYDDCYPTLEKNSSLLYFSSEGHNTMGGFDLFVSIVDLPNLDFKAPDNVGYPLNTTDDNMNITFAAKGKYAYVSAYRTDSEGGLDIYRVNFKDADPLYTTIKGYVLNEDSTTFNIPLRIEVFEKKGGGLYGIFEVNPKKGNFIMILPPNIYELNIEIPGKGYFKKKYVVQDRDKYVKEVTKNITVTFDTPEENQSSQ